MANVNMAFGLKPVRYKTGAPYNGACNPYIVASGDSTALAIGDPVVRSGTTLNGLPTIVRATAGSTNQITGVVVGFEINPSIVANGYRLGSTEQVVLVADDPDLEFEIQEDSDSNAVEITEMGLNANLVAGTLSTYSKKSGFMLDSTSAAADATMQLRILGVPRRVDNEFPANYAKLLVMINIHTERPSAVAGI
jgi:hypothetical protein